jgi:hypothetical protein
VHSITFSSLYNRLVCHLRSAVRPYDAYTICTLCTATAGSFPAVHAAFALRLGTNSLHTTITTLTYRALSPMPPPLQFAQP